MQCKERNVYILYSYYWYCNVFVHCKGEEMRGIIHGKETGPKSEKFLMNALDLNFTKTRGRLMCRLSSLHPIPYLSRDLSAPNFIYPSNSLSLPLSPRT